MNSSANSLLPFEGKYIQNSFNIRVTLALQLKLKLAFSFDKHENRLNRCLVIIDAIYWVSSMNWAAGWALYLHRIIWPSQAVVAEWQFQSRSRWLPSPWSFHSAILPLTDHSFTKPVCSWTRPIRFHFFLPSDLTFGFPWGISLKKLNLGQNW